MRGPHLRLPDTAVTPFIRSATVPQSQGLPCLPSTHGSGAEPPKQLKTDGTGPKSITRGEPEESLEQFHDCVIIVQISADRQKILVIIQD